MIFAIGDIVCCIIPFTTNYEVIAKIEHICQGNEPFGLSVHVLHSDDELLINRTGWRTTTALVTINFGQTDLNTIRQTHPEYFI